MLLQVLKKLAGRVSPSRRNTEPDLVLLERAHALALQDNRAAIKAYREYLQNAPADVAALNGLAACLADIGDLAQAASVFELAYSLDDTFIPAMVNHGKLLHDHRQAQEALKYLRRAKIVQPSFMHTDAVYAGICLKCGETARARAFQLKSSLSNFDNLRLSNCYLFWTSYDDVSERLVAAEHRFWAETSLVPSVEGSDSEDDEARRADGAVTGPVAAARAPDGRRRLRIGYWSPDFRNHSVRYFFRPLLDAHDRERFEIFIYHDFPTSDGHTQAVREKSDHFHDVFEKTDAQLYRFIRSHKLDVLVELAGHTSNNRVSLLHHRMATVQLTALGYPLTTGLRSVDGKVLDRFTSTPLDRHFYAEKPVVLPTSFWCFDPKEDVPIAPEPPVVRNGYLTFGCVGNVAKITPPALRAWSAILAQVERSRLLIRSISFEDPYAEAAVRRMLQDAGFPMDRVDLVPPRGGVEFFASYDEVDIVLDTFPFNGGTTTCFAAYMGVPVVTLCGESLLGRMGRSVMGNLGAEHLAVDAWDDYVRTAVATGRDVEWLRTFKKEARGRFTGCALGNGEMFAREFEQACIDLVDEKEAGRGGNWEPAIDLLPPAEIMRRAYAVLRNGQVGAAQRILDHCLREYPACGPAHLVVAQQHASAGDSGRAIAYLRERLGTFSTADRQSALIFITRQHLLVDQRAAAAAVLAELRALPLEDEFDSLQVKLYEAALAPAPAAPEWVPPQTVRSVHVVIPSDGDGPYQQVREQFERMVACPPGWTVTYARCSEQGRIAAYRKALQAPGADIVLLVQKNARVLQPRFLLDVEQALQSADIVGFAGATRWSRIDWRSDAFEVKAGALLAPSYEREGRTEVQVFGPGRQPFMAGMAVLDGTLLAIQARAALPDAWDEDCLGYETLLEEVWTHDAARAGARLAVCGGLGVQVDPAVGLDNRNRPEARVHCADKLGLDPFAVHADDQMALSVPAADGPEAARICRAYLGAGG